MTDMRIDVLPQTQVEATARALVTRLFALAGQNSAQAVNSVCMNYPRLTGLAVATSAELAALDGVGAVRAELLTSAIAFGELALHNLNTPTKQVVSSDQLGENLVHRMAGEVQEQMLVYFLNVKNEVIEEATMFKGSIESSITDQRVILRRAILLGASRLIVAHNHPSGSVSPSPEDQEMTDRLFTSGQLMGIRLLDHIIVGRDDYLSFREEGDL
ncbi:JAB domain-containing protein [Lacticaseibacillus hulanensis]|uniref:JAB domain-containing protein n=1 Tax=Lacticaseibacillus hulanensis TaxID=2493111 RepID=UPI000FDAE254|nr:DNA repair protein RadC [Lacticaseibacillus hulanensis]